MLGDTSLKTLVGETNIWQNFLLNPIKYWIWPICTSFFLGKINKNFHWKFLHHKDLREYPIKSAKSFPKNFCTKFFWIEEIFRQKLSGGTLWALLKISPPQRSQGISHKICKIFPKKFLHKNFLDRGNFLDKTFRGYSISIILMGTLFRLIIVQNQTRGQ